MIETGTIDVETLKEDLIAFVDFDEDASGSNGKEYILWDDAIEAGCDTNAEYWACIAMDKYNEEIHVNKSNIPTALYKAVNVFLELLEGTWTHLGETEYEINNASDTSVDITFVCAGH